MKIMSKEQHARLLEQVTGAFVGGRGREVIWPKLQKQREAYGRDAISLLVDRAEDLSREVQRRRAARAQTPVEVHSDDVVNLSVEEHSETPKITEQPQQIALSPQYLAGLEALRQELAEGGGENFIDTDLIDRFTGLVEGKVPAPHLDAFNADLKKAKGGTLTHADIAFIGCVHRRSILENRGESPFKRIKESVVKFGFRDRPFDDRQVRYALMILSHAGFTKQVAESVYNHKDKSKSRAGVWELIDDPYWTDAFGDASEESDSAPI
jgi:hypothetical protein